MKYASVAGLIMTMASLVPTAGAGAQTLPTKLVYQQDLVYQGSFTFQNVKTTCSQGTFDFEYVHGVVAFNPASNSLFVVGHGACQFVAEWNVPALGGVASVRQQAADVTGGKLAQINPSDPNSKAIGGLMVIGDRLIATGYSTYDGAASASASHFVRSTALGSGSTTGPYRVGDRNPAFYAGYMTWIPAAWRSAFGGDVLTGQCCLSIISRTSFGPSTSVVSSSDLVAARNPTTATMVLGYPEGHLTLGPGTTQSTVFSLTSQPRGIVFPEGTNSVLFFGKHGTGPYCYGEGAACNDPADNSKGTHAYPYVPYVWAFRASDLADVRAGRKQPWDVTPYATFRLPSQVQTHQIGGAAYDAASGRLYIVENYGGGNNTPRVHVFTISGGSTSTPSADTTNPTVSLTTPSGGTVSGTVSLAAAAADNTGVTGVWFTVDGAAVGSEDTSVPYQGSWNTATVANGSHTIRALARDAAGNTATSAAVTVTVSNGGAADSTAPAVSLTAPAASATVSGQVTVSASASDNVGVATVQFTLNGTNLGAADSSSPYSLSWDTRGAANGLYILRAEARDAAGNTTTSAARNVTVNNVSSDTSRPSVSLTAPSSGATIANTVTVSASASDNVGVTAVQFTLNGVNLGSPDTSAPYAISWNTRGAANGTHLLRAIARDAAGNTRTSSSRYVTVGNTATTSTPPPSTPPPSTLPPSTPAPSTCATPDPFVAMGGGTCYNGGWLPPGMTPPTSGNSPSAPSAPAAPSVPSTPSAAVACTSLRPGAGWTCYNGGWLPPGMTPPTAAQPPSSAPATPAGPSSAAPCASVRPAADWVCHNGGWLPPGMALPTSGSGTTSPSTSVPSAPATCTSPQPGAGWACHNGGWLPPGMQPLQVPVLPASPSSPAGCLTPRPGSDWVCSNGGWLPPNFPGV